MVYIGRQREIRLFIKPALIRLCVNELRTAVNDPISAGSFLVPLVCYVSPVVANVTGVGFMLYVVHRLLNCHNLVSVSDNARAQTILSLSAGRQVVVVRCCYCCHSTAAVVKLTKLFSISSPHNWVYYLFLAITTDWICVPIKWQINELSILFLRWSSSSLNNIKVCKESLSPASKCPPVSWSLQVHRGIGIDMPCCCRLALLFTNWCR